MAEGSQWKNTQDPRFLAPAPLIATVLLEVQKFVIGSEDDDQSRRKHPIWCGPCRRVLCWLKPFLPSQRPGWRSHILDNQDHTGHLAEIIEPTEWSNLDAPGIVGRTARISYETMRNMNPDTALRILAKIPRHRRMTSERIEEVARSIVSDPILREKLTPGRHTK